MSDEVGVVLSGICGYGEQYLRALLERDGQGCRLAACIARRPQRSRFLPEIEKRGIPVFHDLAAFYAAERAELVILNVPIQLHCAHTLEVLRNGSNVLCEKPVSATIQDAWAMVEAERESPHFAAIGYQWSFSGAIQALKADILAGRLGRPLRLKTLVMWPRNKAYYGRNDWAGALRTPAGDWVLDSPLGNATAHFLHNMFYLVGPSRERSAWPVEIQAELYRANAISNFDTAALRCRTDSGIELLYFTSHAVPSGIGPVVFYEFENAVVYFEESRHGRFLARFEDGGIKDYGNPSADHWHKIWQCADAVRSGQPVACNTESATPVTLAINGAQESQPEVVAFPDAMINEVPHEGNPLVWVSRLQQAFVQCYDQWLLPAEHGALSWAGAGRRVDLRGYRSFPGGAEPQ